MAERRMFAKTIIDSDAFLDMPLSTQALYFHLSMRADDEGFINNPRKIQRMVGASDDDLKILEAKNFVIPFESGIVVIKHWRIHNWIRADRIVQTKYTDERSLLQVKENGSYTVAVSQMSDTCQSLDSHMSDSCQSNVSIGKYSIVEDSIDKVNRESKSRAFTPPTLEDVSAYCRERNNKIDAQRFIDFYESKGWMVGQNKMKNWKAAIRTWEQRDKESPKPRKQDYEQRQYSDADYLEMERRKLGIGGS